MARRADPANMVEHLPPRQRVSSASSQSPGERTLRARCVAAKNRMTSLDFQFVAS